MRIGIIGAGQLGQMLGFAARELGHECYFLDPSDDPPAAQAGPVIQAPFDDVVALSILAEKCDVLTYEFENVPVDALAEIEDRATIHPPLDALRHAQDRIAEKRLFGALDIPLPGYRAIDSQGDIEAAIADIGLPLVIKTRRFGYDGKGQFVVRSADDANDAWQELGDAPLIAEQWVAFDFEVSAIGVRNGKGDTTSYCLTLNEHAGGILRSSRAPLENAPLTASANEYLGKLMQHLDYVGVLALELFVVGDTLLANEIAPRVHNSGHWTIEGAATSQFANHILAISGQPPGAVETVGYAGMVNLIGSIPESVRAAGNGVLHDYGKSPRPGRKLGHITVVAENAAARDREMARIADSVTGRTTPSGPGP